VSNRKLSLKSQDTDDNSLQVVIRKMSVPNTYYSTTIEQITLVQHSSIDIRLCGSVRWLITVGKSRYLENMQLQ